jgi:hypothetical protein
MKNISYLLIIILLCLSSCSKDEITDPTAEQPGVIEGKVTGTNDAVLTNVTITTNPPTISTLTDSNGVYSISSVSKGNYTVYASKIYYHKDSVIVLVEPGKKVIANIKLQEKVNNPPANPVAVTPVNNSTGQPVTITLNWSCTDPDGDSLLYDVYLDKINPPVNKVSSNQTETSYTKTGLDSQTVYYWKVVAKDERNAEAVSNIFKFTTVVKPLPTQGLVAYYPFNGNANDESGHGNHGSLIGDMVLTKDRFNFVNRSYQFSNNGYIEIPNSTSLTFANNAISITLWVYVHQWYISEGVKYIPLISKEFDTHDTSIGTDYEMLVVDDSIGIWPWRNIPYYFDLKKWVFICMTWNGNELQVYIDGNIIHKSDEANLINFSNKPIHLGANLYLGDEYLYGILDDIRIFNRALDPAEIGILYHEGSW